MGSCKIIAKTKYLLYMKNSLLNILFVCLISFSSFAQENGVQIKKIWDVAPHNAFTDLIRFENKFYCTFREGTGHVPGETGEDGKIRVLVSEDGDNWESFALIEKKDYDLRDSKLSVTPGNRLMLLMGGSVYDGAKLLSRLTHVTFLSKKTNTFSDPVAVNIDKKIKSDIDWLWRVTWSGATGYGVVYQRESQDSGKAFLVKTKDGIRYSLVAKLDIDGFPNESTVSFNPGKEMTIVVRREGGDKNGYIGTAKSPYREWKWKSLGIRLGGPNLLPITDNIFIMGTRSYFDGISRTALFFAGKNGKTVQLIEFPSGGDTSYPGMLIYDNLLWVSYYSTHEGKSQIYLAKIPMPFVNEQLNSTNGKSFSCESQQ